MIKHLGKRQRQIIKEAATFLQGTTSGWSTGWRAKELDKLEYMGLLRYDFGRSAYFATELGRESLKAYDR